MTVNMRTTISNNFTQGGIVSLRIWIRIKNFLEMPVYDSHVMERKYQLPRKQVPDGAEIMEEQEPVASFFSNRFLHEKKS
jgi:hypothetical protein